MNVTKGPRFDYELQLHESHFLSHGCSAHSLHLQHGFSQHSCCMQPGFSQHFSLHSHPHCFSLQHLGPQLFDLLTAFSFATAYTLTTLGRDDPKHCWPGPQFPLIRLLKPPRIGSGAANVCNNNRID